VFTFEPAEPGKSCRGGRFFRIQLPGALLHDTRVLIRAPQQAAFRKKRS
jgi:hypothetical protein